MHKLLDSKFFLLFNSEKMKNIPLPIKDNIKTECLVYATYKQYSIIHNFEPALAQSVRN